MSNAKNAGYTKEYNRQQILRLLRQQPQSRADLARQTGLTRAAISLIVDELMAEGMVKESVLPADTRSRGRTPVLLKLRHEGAYALGVRLTRTKCRVGLCDLRGGVLRTQTMPLPKNGAALIEILEQAANDLLQDIPRDRVLGVGVSAPGPLDAQKGVILNPPGFEAYHGFEVSEIALRLGLPVWLENDANAEALHNYMDGDFPGRDSFLLLAINGGIGSGVIRKGKLLHECELGHVSLDLHGPQCACGNRGCLEMLACNTRILAQFPEYSTWDALMASPKGEEALQLQGKYLAAALVNFFNLMPVETVLLGGSAETERLAPIIQKHMAGRTLWLGERTVPVLPALQAPDGDIRSAAAIVLGRWLRIC
jgi:predicted NBD/HSP70 family sugar kinase